MSTDFVTKDSGERVEYESGMRRDVDTDKPRFDLLLPEGIPYAEQFLTRFAALMARGAEKYGDRNWELASSDAELRRFKASGLRHFMQWFTGEVDEDHAVATVFNLLAYETTKARIAQVDHDAVEANELAANIRNLFGRSVERFPDGTHYVVGVDPHAWPADQEQPLREALLETFDKCHCGDPVCGESDHAAWAQTLCEHCCEVRCDLYPGTCVGGSQSRASRWSRDGVGDVA